VVVEILKLFRNEQFINVDQTSLARLCLEVFIQSTDAKNWQLVDAFTENKPPIRSAFAS
tara:strand:+ start:252 stop:428 length:177 start_codon:yes stop_codon:yes gene_type:complete